MPVNAPAPLSAQYMVLTVLRPVLLPCVPSPVPSTSQVCGPDARQELLRGV